MPEEVRLRLFGEFALEDSAGRPISLHLRKAEALLAYLALTPGQSSSRENLAALLWGDSDQARARQSLRQVLFALTKAFAQRELSLLRLESQSVRVADGALTVDAVTFERLVADGSKAALAQASALYAGEFLSGFSLDEPGFEEWLSGTRAAFRDTAMRALTELLQEQEKQQEFDQAIETANRALRIDPFREDVHRQLMRVYAANGMRSSALGQYRSCREVLQRELGVLPDEDTTKLYRDILERGSDDTGGEPGPAPDHARPCGPRDVGTRLPSPADGISIGRAEEMESLRAVLEQVGEGGCRLCLLLGEGGVGKSHMLNAFAEEAAADGASVLAARGYQVARGTVLGLWSDVIGEIQGGDPVKPSNDSSDELRDELRRVQAIGAPGAADSGGGGEGVRAAYDAVVDCLGRVARDRALVLLFDDLHWADDESLRLVLHAVRRLRRAPVLMLCAAPAVAVRRRSLLGDVVRDLERDRRVSLIDLQPLTREQSIDLAWQLQQALNVKRDSKSRLNRIWQLSEGNPRVIRESVLAGADHDAGARGGEVPLARALLDEVALWQSRIGRPAQHLLTAAAVIGQRAEYAVARRAAGLGEDAAAGALDELVAEGVMSVEGEDIAFVRRRVALAVYEDLLPPRRKLLHAAVAQAIEQTHGGVLEPYFQDLAAHYRRSGDDLRALRFDLEAAHVQIKRGLPPAARRLFESTLDAARRMERSDETSGIEIDAHLGLALLSEMEEDWAQAGKSLDGADALAARHGEPRQLALLGMARARLCAVAGNLEGAYDLARQALAQGDRCASSLLWLPAEQLMAHVHLIGGASARVIGRMNRRRDHCARLGLREDEADALAILGLLHAVRGDFEEAGHCCENAVAVADSIANEAYMAACLQARGIVESWQGDGAAALASFERALETAEARGDVLRVYTLTGHKGLALLSAGRIRPAIAALEEAVALAQRLNTGVFLPLFKAWLAEASIGVGGDEDTLRLAREALHLASESNQAWARSIACRALARVLARPSCRDLSAADRAIRTAVAAQTGLALKFEAARSLIVHAKILRAWGNARRSSEIFAEAGEIFESMGMTADFDRAKTMAEALRPASGKAS